MGQAGPDGISEVMIKVLLEQREAVSQNQPFRYQFHPDRGFVIFKHDEGWLLARIEGQIKSKTQKWECFYNFLLLKVFEDDGTSCPALASLTNDTAWEAF